MNYLENKQKISRSRCLLELIEMIFERVYSSKIKIELSRTDQERLELGYIFSSILNNHLMDCFVVKRLIFSKSSYGTVSNFTSFKVVGKPNSL